MRGKCYNTRATRRMKKTNPKTWRLYGAKDARLEDIELEAAGEEGVVVEIVTNTICLSDYKGATLGTGSYAVGTNATLQVAESGTNAVGNLTLKDGATLAFNFTDKTSAPNLDLTGKTVTRDGMVLVKVTGARPFGTDVVLTSGGKFTGATVSLAVGSAKWAASVSVNSDGNIVVSRRRGFTILVK